MIKSKLIIYLFCVQSALFAMSNKEELANYLNDLKSDYKELFTQEEENILSKSINMLNNDSSISHWMQLRGMRCALQEILEKKKTAHDEKCTCGESNFSHNEQIEKINTTIQTHLNNFVAEEEARLCKKIASCVKITSFTSAGFLLTYGITLFIRAINEEV